MAGKNYGNSWEKGAIVGGIIFVLLSLLSFSIPNTIFALLTGAVFGAISGYIYDKHRIKKEIIIVILSLAVLLLLFMWFGKFGIFESIPVTPQNSQLKIVAFIVDPNPALKGQIFTFGVRLTMDTNPGGYPSEYTGSYKLKLLDSSGSILSQTSGVGQVSSGGGSKDYTTTYLIPTSYSQQKSYIKFEDLNNPNFQYPVGEISVSEQITPTTTTIQPTTTLAISITTTTIPPQSSGCYDSDGGNNIYKKGTTYLSGIEQITDFCVNPTRIKELICSGFSSVNAIDTDCPSGYSCSNGECVSTPTTTTIQPTTTSITTTTISPPICTTQQLNVFENIWNILLGWISRIQPKVICY